MLQGQAGLLAEALREDNIAFKGDFVSRSDDVHVG
jgi:hypothetical protein